MGKAKHRTGPLERAKITKRKKDRKRAEARTIRAIRDAVPARTIGQPIDEQE